MKTKANHNLKPTYVPPRIEVFQFLTDELMGTPLIVSNATIEDLPNEEVITD